MKISKQTAEHYSWGKQCDGWHLLQQEGLSIIHERMPAGTDEARHYHHKAQQFFFILIGEAEMEMDGVVYELSPHEGIEVPPETVHQIFNRSVTPIEFLVISQPSTKGERKLVK
jgi:mannose-6-phosphate isomerase-like protein (cupin superfamily)